MSGSTVRPRIWELRDHYGLIEDTGKRRPSPLGSLMTVYALTTCTSCGLDFIGRDQVVQLFTKPHHPECATPPRKHRLSPSE